MKRICVFCGSSPGGSPTYAQAARETGSLLANRGLGLVYGGGNVGLMGMVADAALAAGGEVIGVIPRALRERELAHLGATTMHVVPDMLERKRMMADLADGFLTLPGGLGTLDELFEMLTWNQLGSQEKPCGVLNVEGFYDALLTLLDHSQQERFLRPEHRDLLLVEHQPEPLLERMLAWRPSPVEKWLDREFPRK